MKANMLKFIEKFMCKYLGPEVLEDVVLSFLKELVNKTGSKIDDEIYNIVFNRVAKGSGHDDRIL